MSQSLTHGRRSRMNEDMRVLIFKVSTISCSNCGRAGRRRSTNERIQSDLAKLCSRRRKYYPPFDHATANLCHHSCGRNSPISCVDTYGMPSGMLFRAHMFTLDAQDYMYTKDFPAVHRE